MSGNELLFWGGIGTVIVAAVSGLISTIVLKIKQSRLNKQLEVEYGKKRH